MRNGKASLKAYVLFSGGRDVSKEESVFNKERGIYYSEI